MGRVNIQDQEYDLQKLNYQRADALIFKSKEHLTADAHERLRASIKRTFGEDAKAIVLDKGADLAVVREVKP